MKRRVSDRSKSIIGLDLSLRASAACWMPWEWSEKADTTKLKMTTVGMQLTKDATPQERIVRLLHISEVLVAFILEHGADAVYVEGYAFAAISSSATELHELGGVVKAEIFKTCGHAPIPVTASACRKTLLQKLPKKNQKRFTEDNIRKLKGEALYWDGDQVDAFCVANHGMMLEGGVPLSFLGT